MYNAKGDTRQYCDAVKSQFVDELLPTAPWYKPWAKSSYCQYANCGEGGLVGACLAFDFGFRDDEIRVCTSENDHLFAMVVSSEPNDWCLLDRWNNIGFFRCGVNWDPVKEVVIVDGEPTEENWFQRVKCVTLGEESVAR